MTVGKPDFNLNSFGIQYKEKNVKYTEDLIKVSAIDNKTTIGNAIPKEEKQTSGGQAADTRLSNGGFDRKEPNLRAADAYPKGTTVPVGKKPTLHESGQMGNAAVNINDEEDKKGLSYVQPSGKSPADLKRKAAETILKAVLLKLDLMKTLASNAGSTVVEEGTSPTKPNHIGANGVRTQDGQHTVLAHAIGTPKQETITNADGTKKIINRPRTAEEVTHKKGNEKRSLAGDMQMSKELNNKTPEQIKESMDLITNSETYQEGIHRDAPLTEKEGTDKFDAADPKTQAILARQAKRDAAKKKRGEIVNHAISEINAMTDGMKELMKREGVKIGMGEKDTRQSQDRFNEDHLSDFPEMKGTKEGKEVERHMNDHVSPVDN